MKAQWELLGAAVVLITSADEMELFRFGIATVIAVTEMDRNLEDCTGNVLVYYNSST